MGQTVAVKYSKKGEQPDTLSDVSELIIKNKGTDFIELTEEECILNNLESTQVKEYKNAKVNNANIESGNIKKDVSILGVIGTMDYLKTIDSVPETKDTSIIVVNGTYYLWREA